MSTSPTQRSLKYLRDLGYIAAVVEKWNPYAKVRQDVFGFGDILCAGPVLAVRTAVPPIIFLIQTTTSSNLAARQKKIEGIDAAKVWLAANGRIFCHGWAKKKGRWVVTERVASLDNGEIVWRQQ